MSATRRTIGWEDEPPLWPCGSMLELFHPDAYTPRTHVLGSHCPAVLCPSSNPGRSEVDLFVVAPTVAECQKRQWLQAAVQRMATALAPEGVGYLLVPVAWRRRSIALCRQYGLLPVPSLAHVPNVGSSRYLVPFEAAPMRYATSLVRIAGWRQSLVTLGLRCRSIVQLLSLIRPSTGIVVRHPGARPLFDWLFRLDDAATPTGSVIVGRSWRGGDGSTLLYRFPQDQAVPSALAKARPRGELSEQGTSEAALLARLGPSALRAGARVPRILFAGPVGPWSLLVETLVPGQALVVRLNEHPDQLGAILDQIGEWLANWHGATAVMQSLDARQLHRMILEPAMRLAPLLRGGGDYTRWLDGRCAAVLGRGIPLVATHNDLTMMNILMDESGQLGVVDWETAADLRWPLVDFFYATVDAVAATERYRDRPGAFDACFAPGGARASEVARRLARLLRTLDISPPVASLCFHACWLQHAANERSARPADPQRPFLRILQRLASHPSAFSIERST